jgi:lipopolysaccharide/colanic/teichoic acid biosynthesis glycosyltransferase
MSKKSYFYQRIIKRGLDLFFSALFLIILSPFLGIFALLVRLDSRGKVIFIQQRLGKNGRIFNAFKFRTMTDRPRTIHHEVDSHNPELTTMGKFLRRFKLDELPQLWDILRGNMSFVGPRPALPEQINDYDAKSRRRLEVLPGVTGMAQVHGNIYLTWPQRWLYDVEYVERISFGLDFWIILRTIAVVLFGEKRFYKPPETTNSKAQA